MIVLRKDFNVYKPKLSIESCIILEQLFGSVTKPIESNIPSLSEQVFLLSLCLSQYNLSEDELYELIDDIDDLFSLIIDLYTEAGLINQEQDSNDSERQETTSNDKVEDTPQSFEEMCNDMLIQCMSIGLSRQEFYNSTFKEVRQYSQAYQQQQKNEAINRALDTYQLADLISVSVGRLLSKEIKMPKFEVYYKHLFEDVDTSEEEQTQSEDSGLTAEEMRTSAMILEWAMSQQRKQEQKKKQETKECEGE